MPSSPHLRGPLTRLLIRRIVRGWEDPRRPGVAIRIGLVALAVGVATNTVLFSTKLALGVTLGSLAFIADAVDSAGDVLLDLVGLVGLLVSRRGPDPAHPYGHERAEEIAALTVGVLMVVAAFYLAWTGVDALLGDRFDVSFSWVAIGVALAAVLAKLFIHRFTHNLAHYTSSSLLEGSSLHYATDVPAGLLAAVAIAARRFGYYSLDAWFAIVIACLVALTGVRVYMRASDRLLGRGGSRELLEEIHRVACGTQGVVGCSDIEVHWYGRKRRVSMRIQVPDSLTLAEGHEIAQRVEERLHGLHADWEPVIHVDPVHAASKAKPVP